jgi:hypothetical protein
MKGQFEFSPEILDMDMTEMEIVHIMLDQQLEKANVPQNQRVVTGWFARRTDPYTGNRIYMWDTSITYKMSKPRYLEYLHILELEGWEIAFNYKYLKSIS